MTIYTSDREISALYNLLEKASHDRKEFRKRAAKILRINCQLLSNGRIKKKIQGSYFKDLSDQSVLEGLDDLYWK